MDPDQNRLARIHVAELEDEVLRPVERVLVGDGGEGPEGGREHRLGEAAHEGLTAQPVADQRRHADHPDSVRLAELDEVGQARHRAVLVHDLADDRRRVQPGEPGEIDSRLGLSGALEHAARPGAQREDVTGAAQVAGPGSGVDRGLDGAGAVGGRDAGGHALARLDGDAERGLQRGSVVPDHERDVQLVEALAGHRETDQAPAVGGHEVDRVGRDVRGRDGQVALVLAVGVVHDDHHAPGGDFGDRGVGAEERGFFAQCAGILPS